MAAEKVMHELEAVRQHLRWLVLSISTTPMMGGKVNVHFQGEGIMHRDLLLLDTNENEVRTCLAVVWPEHTGGEVSEDSVIIRRNGQYVSQAEDQAAAKSYIAHNIGSEEEIWVVEDQAGQLTRFVTNQDGSLEQLD